MTVARDLTNADALGILRPFIGGQTGTRVTLPAHLGYVTYEYCDAGGCRAIPLHNVDPRFGVFLLRLGEFMSGAYGVTVIRHFGVSPGASGQPSHNNGIAIDIAAFVTASGEVYSILKDWGAMPPVPGAYRLKSGMKGFDLFKSVYAFTSHEGDDKYGGAESIIGTEDTYIRHPDLRDPKAAALHKDHLHLQAGQAIKGPTGGVAPAPVPVATAGVSGGGLAALLVLAAGVGAAVYFGSGSSSGRVPLSTPTRAPKRTSAARDTKDEDQEP